MPFSSTTKNAAGLFWKWNGRVFLNPDSDYWTDTVQLPDVNVNVDNFDDNWAQSGAWGTSWNSQSWIAPRFNLWPREFSRSLEDR